MVPCELPTRSRATPPLGEGSHSSPRRSTSPWVTSQSPRNEPLGKFRKFPSIGGSKPVNDPSETRSSMCSISTGTTVPTMVPLAEFSSTFMKLRTASNSRLLTRFRIRSFEPATSATTPPAPKPSNCQFAIKPFGISVSSNSVNWLPSISAVDLCSSQTRTSYSVPLNSLVSE